MSRLYNARRKAAEAMGGGLRWDPEVNTSRRLTMCRITVFTIGIVSALLIAACGGGTKTVTRVKMPTTETTTRSGSSSTSGKLALHRMTEADALKALSARANKLAGEDELSGAVLVAKDDRVLFSRAYGLADRKQSGSRTPSARAFASGR